MVARWVSELFCRITWVRLPTHLEQVAVVAGLRSQQLQQHRLLRRAQRARLRPDPMQRQSLALCHVQPVPMRRWVVRRTRLPQALGLQCQPLRLDEQPLREAPHR